MIPISTVYFLCLFYSMTKTTTAVECFQCIGDYGGVRCSETCTGDLCAVWKWHTRSETLIRQGCLSGLDRRFTAKVGCRNNHLGASLCLCDDGDLCNRVDRTDNTLRPLPVVRLPSVDCISKVTGSGIFGSKRQHVCSANFCHMSKTETYSHDLTSLSLYNCADVAEFDFDVRLKNTAAFPGLYPNGCYKLQSQPRQVTVDCTCSKNHCNSVIPEVKSGPVRCYMAYGSANHTQVDIHSFCDGDFCFIQKEEGKYTKGCISANERNAWSHIASGRRHIVGVDQWLCQSHLCNLDVERAERSISPSPSSLVHHPKSNNAENKDERGLLVYFNILVILYLF